MEHVFRSDKWTGILNKRRRATKLSKAWLTLESLACYHQFLQAMIVNNIPGNNAHPLITEYGGYLARQITAGNEGSLKWKLTCPDQLTLYQGIRWFSVKHQLQDWMDGAGRLGVSQPKPIVYTSPCQNSAALLMKRQRWIFYNRGVILTLIHGLGPPFF